MKKVMILTADAGFGHRSAARAIAEAFKEKHSRGCEVEVINPLDDPRTLPLLRESQTDYDWMMNNWPDIYRITYQASGSAVPTKVMESALTLMLFEVMRDLLRRHAPDVIITTYPLYQAPLGPILGRRKRPIPLLTVITDLTSVHRVWFNPAATLCLAPTQEIYDLALASGLNPQQVRINGIPVHPSLAREKRSPDEIRAALGWRNDLKIALVVASRRVKRALLLETLRAINHSQLPLQLVIVAGGDNELYELAQQIEWHLPTSVYNFVPNLAEMMCASDLVISKAGGLIVTESLACGLPLLIIEALPGQEVGNADYVVQGGAGVLSPDPISSLETLFHWLAEDARLLAERAANARKLGQPEAAYTVAQLAWEAIQHTEPLKRSSPKPFIRPSHQRFILRARRQKGIQAALHRLQLIRKPLESRTGALPEELLPGEEGRNST